MCFLYEPVRKPIVDLIPAAKAKAVRAKEVRVAGGKAVLIPVPFIEDKVPVEPMLGEDPIVNSLVAYPIATSLVTDQSSSWPRLKSSIENARSSSRTLSRRST